MNWMPYMIALTGMFAWGILDCIRNNVTLSQSIFPDLAICFIVASIVTAIGLFGEMFKKS